MFGGGSLLFRSRRLFKGKVDNAVLFFFFEMIFDLFLLFISYVCFVLCLMLRAKS